MGISMFLAKGLKGDDAVLVAREASATRPISMKNTDNKAVGGVANFILSFAFSPAASAGSEIPFSEYAAIDSMSSPLTPLGFRSEASFQFSSRSYRKRLS